MHPPATRLVPNAHQCAWLKALQAHQNRRHQGLQRFESVIVRNQDDDGHRQRAKILLVLEILIGCEKHVELRSSGTQEFAIFYT